MEEEDYIYSTPPRCEGLVESRYGVSRCNKLPVKGSKLCESCLGILVTTRNGRHLIDGQTYSNTAVSG